MEPDRSPLFLRPRYLARRWFRGRGMRETFGTIPAYNLAGRGVLQVAVFGLWRPHHHPDHCRVVFVWDTQGLGELAHTVGFRQYFSPARGGWAYLRNFRR